MISISGSPALQAVAVRFEVAPHVLFGFRRHWAQRFQLFVGFVVHDHFLCRLVLRLTECIRSRSKNSSTVRPILEWKLCFQNTTRVVRSPLLEKRGGAPHRALEVVQSVREVDNPSGLAIAETDCRGEHPL
jgi:hypothetical protein